jgi:hypothetical protein
MKTITPSQLKCFNTLVHKRGFDKESKEMLVRGISGGRVTSSKDLFFDEAAEAIKHLQSLQPNQAAAEKMRNKILYYAHEMNWRKAFKVDMKRVDEWCKKFGYLHKALDQYEYNELPKLITQFEAVYKHYLSSL